MLKNTTGGPYKKNPGEKECRMICWMESKEEEKTSLSCDARAHFWVVLCTHHAIEVKTDRLTFIFFATQFHTKQIRCKHDAISTLTHIHKKERRDTKEKWRTPLMKCAHLFSLSNNFLFDEAKVDQHTTSFYAFWSFSAR